MKAIITKIQDSKVYAKSVNPLGEMPPYVSLFEAAWKRDVWKIKYNKWQQAESDRVELELHEDDYYGQGDNCFIYRVSNSWEKLIYLGQSIQVTREGDYFKII